MSELKEMSERGVGGQPCKEFDNISFIVRITPRNIDIASIQSMEVILRAPRTI
jgi:hypothetical protein